MKRGLALVTLLAFLALPLAAPAVAESHEEMAPPQPIIWVSFLKSPPGGGQTLVETVIKQNGDLWGDLLAAGKILEWGVAQPINHRGDDPYNVAEWATFVDWAAVDAFVSGFMAMQAAKSPEELAASQEEYLAATVPGSHSDAVLQSIHTATNGERPGYIVIGYQKARPGMAGPLSEMWKTHAQPVYEKLMADGAIQGFGLFSQGLHGDNRWTYGSWATMSGLAGIGAVDKALSGIPAETIAKFMQMVDPDAHWDEVLAVVHYENASQ